MTASEEWWGVAEAASYCGIAPSTWRDAVHTGRAPAPEIRVGGSPGWRPETVREWNATQRRRPGRPRKTQPKRRAAQ